MEQVFYHKRVLHQGVGALRTKDSGCSEGQNMRMATLIEIQRLPFIVRDWTDTPPL